MKQTGMGSEALSMVSGLLADAVVVVHFSFILFVGVGALLVWLWPRLAWLHLPAVLWGAALSLFGWQCPLTALEQDLRVLSGAAGYGTGFIDYYLLPIIYPAGLTPELQVFIGIALLAVNFISYGAAFLRWKRR
ncbi:MAG: DUF2784 domain-containing protein [Bdellovibrionales bacterium]|nr:DUF2784 domain-containing protein [Bdellovibrionales bacterium]